MAGGGRARIPAWAAVSALLGCLLAGAAPPPGPESRARAEVQALLDAASRAVLDGDRDAYLAALGDPAGTRTRTPRRTFANLRALPLAEYAARVTSLTLDGSAARARVEVRHRLRGYDRAPFRHVEELALTRTADRWRVTGELPGSARQLWEQGELDVVRGRHSLVLGVGHRRSTLEALADVADRAVPAVSAAWPGRWAGRVVVEMPPDLAGMGGALGDPPEEYRGVAAVTTGAPGGAAGRVVVNPEAYDLLSPTGREVVLTHETTHVAVRPSSGTTTPLWLSEGFADWVGYRGRGLTPAQAAPELALAVDAGRVPDRLPRDEDFRFSSSAASLGRAYGAAWTVCLMVAEQWGERALAGLHAAFGDGPRGRPGATDTDDVLRSELGVSEEEFTARWRSYVRRLLG